MTLRKKLLLLIVPLLIIGGLSLLDARINQIQAAPGEAVSPPKSVNSQLKPTYVIQQQNIPDPPQVKYPERLSHDQDFRYPDDAPKYPPPEFDYGQHAHDLRFNEIKQHHMLVPLAVKDREGYRWDFYYDYTDRTYRDAVTLLDLGKSLKFGNRTAEMGPILPPPVLHAHKDNTPEQNKQAFENHYWWQAFADAAGWCPHEGVRMHWSWSAMQAGWTPNIDIDKHLVKQLKARGVEDPKPERPLPWRP